MQNKYILHLLAANLLWSLIPALVLGLFDEISIFMIIFLRFFISGVIFFIISLLYVFFNNKSTKIDEMKIPLKMLFNFTKNKNRAFYNLKFIYYFAILGFFGLILQIIFFFFAMKVSTIALTMIGFQLSIVLVAFYEHGVKSEKLDFFKILYLIILIFSIGIIMFVELQNPSKEVNGISFWGVFYIILFTILLSFFHISISKESYTKGEIKIVNINENYKKIRLIFKISLIFLTGIALMFPFLLIFYFLPFQGDLKTETIQFFGEFSILFQILFRWEILFLIVFSTIIPFLLIFIAQVNWSPYNLTYSQWGAILTIIEPIGGIVFGVLIANQYFPIEYLIIIVFLLMISLLFRYIHEEKNKVNAIILIKIKKGFLNILPVKLLKFDGVVGVNSLVGAHDLLINVKTNSIKDFYFLMDTQIRNLKGIKNIKKILFINKINKINIE